MATKNSASVKISNSSESQESEALEQQSRRESNAALASPEITAHYPEFRRLLLQRRTELLQHTDLERDALSAQVMTAPGDVGDVSVIDTSADYFLKLADNDRRELLEITDALDRLRRGTYGVCEVCENDIPVERLKHVLHARRCLDDQQLAESRARSSRPQPLPKL